MSARMTGLVFAHYPCGGGEMVLALAIADHAHDDGTHVKPGLNALAAKSRQSRNTVRLQIRKMVERGWLQVVDAPHGRGEKSFTEYRIDPHWIAKSCGDCPTTEGATDKPLRHQNEVSTVNLTPQNEASKLHLKPDAANLRHQNEVSKRNSGGGKGGVLFTVLNNKVLHVGDCVDANDASLKKDAELCIWMLGLIRKNVNVKHGDPRNWRRWLDVVRLMRTQDRRSHREIADMFHWANADNFWRANILSPGKLREKWDQLAARRNSPAAGGVISVVHSRECLHPGCGAKGVMSFSTDGSDWWCRKHYEQEQLSREGVTN